MKKTGASQYNLRMESPIGKLWLSSDGEAITRLSFSEIIDEGFVSCPVLKRACLELQEYFAGTRSVFDVPLRPMGTEFQRADWAALCKIPYGTTATYRDIAIALGKSNACRAVGMANHANPIAIMIPCHRVVGKNGALAGYGGGLDRKRFLLALEANCVEL